MRVSVCLCVSVIEIEIACCCARILRNLNKHFSLKKKNTKTKKQLNRN